MTKRQDKQSDEAALVLTTARVLQEHLTSHGSLKQASDGAAALAEVLKPFDKQDTTTEETANG